MVNLICVCRFNPPEIRLIGTTLREETIKKLDEKIPNVTTTSHSPKQPPPVFEQVQSSSGGHHWKVNISGQYCDHAGRSMIMLTLIEALEAEDWKMKAAHAVTHSYSQWKSVDAGMDTHRLFFHRA